MRSARRIGGRDPGGLCLINPSQSTGVLRDFFRNGPITVSESTVSNAEPSEIFGPHRVPGRELSEFRSACY